MITYNFQDKVAVIVGASRGIGSCVATRLAESGARTCFISRSGASKVINELEKKSLSVSDFQLDVCNKEQVNNTIKQIIDDYKKIDILINSQAINQCVKIEEISLEDWSSVINTNLTSIFLSCKACIPSMKEKKYGKIINLSSVAARNRSPVSGVHYVASKAGIVGFSRQLAYEVAPYNINVNVVCPGQTKTPMLMNSMTKLAQENLIKGIPLQRIAEPDDQANVIMFLASDESNYLSGAVLDVNGGQI